MGFTILIYLILVVSMVLIVLLIRRRSIIFRKLEFERKVSSIDPSSNPDSPVSFGYKCAWFVVSSEDTIDVVKEAGLTRTKKSTWAYGIEKAYEDKIFISPPVHGWTFIVGFTLAPKSKGSPEEEVSPLLTKLSSLYGTACYFATHRVVEYHAWAKAMQGEITRAFAFSGETGEVVWDVGEATDAEIDIRETPTEDAVLQVADGWSVSPVSLVASMAPPSLGYLGNSLKPKHKYA